MTFYRKISLRFTELASDFYDIQNSRDIFSCTTVMEIEIGLNTCIRWCLQSLGSIELEVAQEFDLFFFGKNYYNNIKNHGLMLFLRFVKIGVNGKIRRKKLLILI